MIDVVASNPSSAKSTTPPSTAAAAASTTYVCSPASPPAINHGRWTFPSSAPTLEYPTSRSGTLSFCLTLPQPPHVCPTTTSTEPLRTNLCGKRLSSHY